MNTYLTALDLVIKQRTVVKKAKILSGEVVQVETFRVSTFRVLEDGGVRVGLRAQAPPEKCPIPNMLSMLYTHHVVL